MKPRFLTVADAAAYTRISQSHLRLLIEQRRIPVIRVGRAIRLLIDDLDSFLFANRIDARPLVAALDINVACYKCGAPTVGRAHLLDFNRALCSACQASAVAVVRNAEELRA